MMVVSRAEPTEEVSMARPPSIFVRELTPDEAVRLRRMARQSKVFDLRQRAQILLASDSGAAAPQIAQVLRTYENQVRRVIGEFNADAMASLRPPTGAGNRGGSMTPPGNGSATSPWPILAISASPAPAGR
jgi:hypothetical protein